MQRYKQNEERRMKNEKLFSEKVDFYAEKDEY